MNERILPESRAVIAIRTATHGAAMQGTTTAGSDDLIKAIAAQVLAAEAAAYERAAKHVAGHESGGGWHNVLASEIRSLSTKGGDRG